MPQPCYILSHGRLRRKNNTLAFEDTDEQGNTRRRYIPIESVSEIYLFGQVDLNSSALSFLAQHHIPMHVFSFYGWYRGTYLPKTPRYYGKLLVEQVQHYLDPARRLVLAREFLTGALTHIKHNLEYYRRRGRQCEESVNAIATALAALPSCSTIASLLQWEGAARKAYYQAVNAIVHLAKPYPGRTRHPPGHELDAALSFCYGLLYGTVTSALYRAMLDPSIGFLHEPGMGRPSLALDIAEIFKPLLAERLVFRLFNRQQLSETSFSKADDGDGGIYLGSSARQLLVNQWEQLLETTVQLHPGQHRSYRMLISDECFKLRAHLLGDSPYHVLVACW